MSADSEHALLSASSSHRWATCSASLRLESALPNTSSKYASEGTAMHTLGAWCLTNGKDTVDYPEVEIKADGYTWKVRPLQDSVQTYVDLVRERTKGMTLLVEQKVNYSHWLGVDHDLGWGTSDAIGLGDDEIVSIDLKGGIGVKVDAFYLDDEGRPQINEQGGNYGLGALYEYEHLGDFKKLTFIISQPRIDHVSEFTIDITALKTFALNMKASAARALKVYNASEAPGLEHFMPGDKACKFCRAKATCPALRVEVEQETRDLFADLVHTPSEVATIPAEIPEDRLAWAMGLVDRVEGWCKAVRAETERRLLAAQPVAGWKLVEGRRGARDWADEQAALKILKRKLGAKNAIKEPEPISPTEAEKRLKPVDPKAYDKLLKKYVTSADGKPSVAPESDKRPALRVNSAVEGLGALASADDLV